MKLEEAGDPADIRRAVSDSATAADDIDRVVMVGDSITVGSTPALEEQFAALGLGVDITSEGGKRMAVSSADNPSGAVVVEELSSAPERVPGKEIWVVALGTNDIGQYAERGEIAAAVDEVLADVPPEAAVVWVDTYFRDRPDQSDAVNEVVHQHVARRGNAVVAPWTSFANADGVLTDDGVHPTVDGSEIFAAVVANTVRTFLDR